MPEWFCLLQTLPAGGDSIQKWRWLTVSLGIKLENKTFQLFTFGRDLGTECIVTTAFQSYPTTKKCVNFFCVGVPMLTKKNIMTNNNVLSFWIR